MRYNEIPVRKIVGYSLSGAAGLVLFLSSFGSWYTIDQGERGVILRNGAVIGEAEPGLHFKFPWIDSVQSVNMQEITLSYAKVSSYSKDQQPADLRVSVTIRATDPRAVYVNYGGLQGFVDRIVSPRLYQQVENTFGQFDAVQAVQNRVGLSTRAQDAIRAAMVGPAEIVSVQIENIDFSDSYEKAVEARMQAIVQQQQADAEKAKRITNADAAAYEITAESDANAHQIEVVSTAEAEAIRKRGAALRDNPALVALTAAEKWNGVLPTTMVPGSAVPFVSVNAR